jgi:phosphatidylinositol alpha-mannosyltransferase
VRIALVCPYAWDDPGGVQVHVRELGERLIERGHDVLGLAPARRPPSQPWVRGVGRPVDIHYNASNAPIDPRPWSKAAVRRELTAFGPEVVHVHQPTAPSTSLWALLEARAPVVGTFHSGATRARLYDVSAPILRRTMKKLAVRIAVSERAAEFDRARIGGRWVVVPNGVDVERFATAEPADIGPGTKLLFVGRLDERKGFPIAVEAFEMLAADRPDLRLVVVGDGPQRGAIDRLDAKLRDRVTMLGRVPNAEIHRVHAACDLYLGPSIGGESFGYVLAEAMAAGLPVVASDTPGYDEVVRNEVEGLLVPPKDPVALAAGAARVLDDPELAARLGRAGRQRAKLYDWPVVVDRLEEIYEEVVSAAGRGPSLR